MSFKKGDRVKVDFKNLHPDYRKEHLTKFKKIEEEDLTGEVLEEDWCGYFRVLFPNMRPYLNLALGEVIKIKKANPTYAECFKVLNDQV